MTNEDAANVLGQELLMTGIRNKVKAEALTLAIAALRRDANIQEAWKRLLATYPEFLAEEDSPGHCHNVIGVWDESNGLPLGGKPCDVCQAWICFLDAVDPGRTSQPGEAPK